MLDRSADATDMRLRTGSEQAGRGAGNRFLPGQSGNPGGRPRLVAEVRELAREHAPAALMRLVELMQSDDERVAIVACREVLDRAYGRPVPMPPETPSALSHEQALDALAGAEAFTQRIAELSARAPGAVDDAATD